MRKIGVSILLVNLLLLLSIVEFPKLANAATIFVVNITEDSNDGVCDSTHCSLREAVIAANNTPGDDTIEIPTGLYVLTRRGTGEDLADIGDLDLRDNVTIIGAGAALTIIDGEFTGTGGGYDRIFDIDPAGTGVTITIVGLTMQGVITSSQVGGGLRNNGELTLLDVVIADNITNQDGGGIYNTGTATIINSRISRNETHDGGGGIANEATGVMFIRNSEISSNRAENASSGGIRNYGVITLTNSTLFSNRTSAFGGAIVNDDGGMVSLNNVTLFSNRADSTGGGIFNATSGGGTVTLKNTILFDNRHGSTISDCHGPLVSEDYNLVGQADCVMQGQIANNMLGVDPLFGNTDFNGGMTKTAELLPGSPAIDAANPLTCEATDQRGVTRTACDIGAYEVANAPFLFPPTVVAVDSPFQTLEQSGLYIDAITQISVTFSEDVQDPAGDADPDDVTNPANYLLVAAGTNQVIETAACGLLGGDDGTISISSVTYDSGQQRATLNLDTGAALPNDHYRLLVCGSTSIVDVDGIALDGNFNSAGGDDFARDFEINSIFETPQTTPLLVNTLEDRVFDGLCSVEHCTLRDAIIAANGSPGTTINIPAGLYTLTVAGNTDDAGYKGDLDITADMTLVGNGASTTMIDGAQLDRVFHTIGPITVIISDLAIQNGRAHFGFFTEDRGGGGFRAEANSQVTLLHTIIQNNTALDAGGDGGGIYSHDDARVVVRESIIQNNQAEGSGGGAIGVDGGDVIVEQSAVLNNTARRGGGLSAASGSPNDGRIEARDTTISGNVASELGGGVYNGFASLSIYFSTISENVAPNGPAGYCSSGGSFHTSIVVGNIGSSPSGLESQGCAANPNNNIIIADDADLGSLQDNGGFSPTYALLPTSEAFGRGIAASCSPADQRGIARDDGGCDYGAFEADFPAHVLDASITNNPSPAATIQFSETLFDPAGDGDPADVTHSDNYRIFIDGADDIFQTAVCGVAQGDDSAIAVDNVIFDPLTNNATLNLNGASALASDRYLLMVCGSSLTDLDGNLFDGNQDGFGGDDFSRIAAIDTPQVGPSLQVNATEDVNDGECGIFHCTLREAVLAANDNSGFTMNIPPGTFTLKLYGFEDEALTGDLDLKTDMSIIGAGPDVTIIDGGRIDRVFEIRDGTTNVFAGVTIQHGQPPNRSDGGAILITSDADNDVTIFNSAVVNNLVGDTGGGIAIYHPEAEVRIINSLVSGNITTGDNDPALWGRGGGIFNWGVLTIENSTISNNSSNRWGGGILNFGSTTLNNVIVTNNTADSNGQGDDEGGGIYNPSGTNLVGDFNLKNSIIAGNHDLSGQAPDCGGGADFNSEDYNLIGVLTGCTMDGDTDNNIIGQDPLLGPLQDNGGSTLTHALQAGSPAIDSANPITCTLVDQRGVFRPQGTACDRGAFEVSPLPFDQIPPAVIRMSTLGSNTNISQLKVAFSEAVQNPPGSTDVDDVTNPANYLLVSAGSNDQFDTSVCGTVQGDDVPVAVDLVTYHPGLFESRLQINGGVALPIARYRLLICGSTSIRDLDGNALDGNLDGTGGDDAIREFIVDAAQSPPDLIVNIFDDVDDGTCGVLHCSLREAIRLANTSPDSIINLSAGTYPLSIVGSSEDSAQTGDLDILASMTIAGGGQSATIIDANRFDRIFQIHNNSSTVLISDLTVQEGLTPRFGQGGGIRNRGDLTLVNVTLRDNRTDDASGGGVYNQNILSVTNSDIHDNLADDGGGGGIHNDGGLLTVLDSTIASNDATNGVVGGGGIHNEDGEVYVRGSTIIDNSAIGGGGIDSRLSNAYLSIENSTISGNMAIFDGGGVATTFSAVTDINNATIVNNIADFDDDGSGQGGGIFSDIDGIINFSNTITAGNIYPDGQPTDCQEGSLGQLVSEDYNLIGTVGLCTISGETGNNILDQDPLLGILQDNGGPTETYALLSGSPAIDAGHAATCETTDQRGAERPDGSACDIGAFELTAAPPPFLPFVVNVNSMQETPDAQLIADERTNVSVTMLLISFNEALHNPVGDTDPDDATNPNNYLLINDGPDRTFQTQVCGSLQGDDEVVSLERADYSAADRTTTLELNGYNPLPDNNYRLLVCGSTSIHDLDGNPLDGNLDGVAGDDFSLDFTVFTPPTVVHIDSVLDSGDGTLDPDEITIEPITELLVTFSEDMNNPPLDADADDVTNPANYRLLSAGANGTLDTVDCISPPGDDVTISIDTVLYDDITFTAALQVNGGNVLPEANYRLFACGSTTLHDLHGDALDGNGDGIEGDDFSLDFHTIPQQIGPDYHVTVTEDINDGLCTYIHCSVREALIAANANPGSTVHIPAGTYIVTITSGIGADETFGDWDITADMTIVGEGRDTTILIGNSMLHNFELHGSINVSIIDVTIAGSSGRGIVNPAGASLTLSDTILRNNHDGAILNSGDLTIIRTLIFDNDSGKEGAGILSITGSLYIIDSVIRDNELYHSGTPNVGTAINRSGEGDFVITGSQITNNSSRFCCAGIYFHSWFGDDTTLALIENTTISNNYNLRDGGALYVFSAAKSLILNNVTIINNVADNGAGIFVDEDRGLNMDIDSFPVQISNSIIWNNTNDTSGEARDLHGLFVSGGYNLIGDVSNADMTGDLTSNLIGVDPLLGPLQDNGGLTETHELLLGSPGIDAGNPAPPGSGGTACAATDQRGVMRPAGTTCDIGAFEEQALGCIIPNPIPAGDTTALIAAINCANLSLGPDTINLTNSTYTLTQINNTTGGGNGLPVISSQIEIVGNSATLERDTNVLDFRLLFVDDAGSLSLSNLTLQNGVADSGGAISHHGQLLSIVNSNLSNHQASNFGGAVFLGGIAGEIHNSTFDGNQGRSGGAVAAFGGTVNISGSAFLNNMASTKGGGVLFEGFGVTNATIATSSVVGNQSVDGGGVFVDGGDLCSGGGEDFESGEECAVPETTVTISATMIDGNTASSLGGGVYVTLNATLDIITSSEITDNIATGDGGGIYNEGPIVADGFPGGALTVSDSLVADNVADRGAGVYNDGGTIIINASEISGNQAAGLGGGLATTGIVGFDGSVTITDSLVTGNQADRGGGLFSDELSTLTLIDSTIESNTAAQGGGVTGLNTVTITGSTLSNNNAIAPDGLGGAIFGSLDMTITNSTISGNDATTEGGGIYVRDDGSSMTAMTQINFSTFVANDAPAGGGIFILGTEGGGLQGNSIEIKHSIVANNLNGSDCVAQSGTILTPIGVNADSDGSCGFSITSDPQLGALQDNGGPTFTHALLLESIVAIDTAADCTTIDGQTVATDQRGLARGFDGNGIHNHPQAGDCDLGAFEVQSTLCIIPDPIPGGDVPALIAAIHCANATPGSQTINLTNSSYTLTAIDNVTDGENGLPAITATNGTANSIITIHGAGAIIERDPAAPDNFRLLHIADDGDLTWDDVLIQHGDNVSQNGGGIDNNGVLTVSNSTFFDNAGLNGGAIHNDGTLTVSNSTFVANAASAGGGISSFGDSATISNSTFSENVASLFGGAISNASGSTLNLRNSILAHSVDLAANPQSDCHNQALTGDNFNNLIENNDLTDPCVPPLVSGDPIFDPSGLQDNGGLTPTIALLPGSPAIDAGNNATCPAADQRAINRPIDGNNDNVAICDMGAYEAPVFVPVTSGPALTSPPNRAMITDNTPMLMWNVVAGGEQYEVHIDDNNNFNTPEVMAVVEATAYISTELADEEYFWRVRAIDRGGVPGPWGASSRFTLDTTPPAVPILNSPASGEIVASNGARFKWNKNKDAALFEIRLDTVNPPVFVIETGKNKYKPPSDLLTTTYYWQVRAIDTAGNVSAWTTIHTLQIVSRSNAVPVLYNFNTPTPTLSWNPTSWATAYEIQIDISHKFNTSALQIHNVLPSNLSLIPDPLADGIWHWRIRARQSDGKWSKWSEGNFIIWT